MTLKEKIFQTFVVTIREINQHGGPQEFFKKYPVGGMYYGEGGIYFDEDGKEAGTSTTFERLMECRKASTVPLLVCADGCKIPGQTVFTETRPLGSSRNAEDAYNMGKILGMQMNSKQVDWVLGPIIDILYDRSMPLYAISDDPEIVAGMLGEVVRGIQDQGVCATVKHFPGLGTNHINMHFGQGRNVLEFDEWMNTYGYAYKECFKKGVMSVMNTHTSLKSYADEYENGFPPIATYSSKLTTQLLKEKLGFEGAVVTDALIMGGMATGDLIEETVQAFKAGADLLLWPPVEAADRIEELILSGEIPMSRLDDALSRIQKMRDFRENALKNKTYDTPDAAFADKTSADIIKRGICCYKNDLGLLPFDSDKIKKILIIDVGSDDEKERSAYLLKNALEKRGFTADVKRDIYDVPSRVCWQKEIDEYQKGYDATIFSLNSNYATDWSVQFMLIWASQLFDKSKKIVLNYGSPLFAEDYFGEEHTIVEMNASPRPAVVEMAADALCGKIAFEGNPVITGKYIKRY